MKRNTILLTIEQFEELEQEGRAGILNDNRFYMSKDQESGKFVPVEVKIIGIDYKI